MTDARLVLNPTADGLLRTFNTAGVLAAADVHVALRLSRLGREKDERVLLAAALAVRAVRLGSVCVELARLADVSVEDPETDVAALPWPDVDDVERALRASPLVTGPLVGALTPLRVVDTDDGVLLYLDRYWRQESTVRQVLKSRDATGPPAEVDPARLAVLFPGPAPDRQRIGAALAATRWTTVFAGGPGTGKTHTVARVLALLHEPGLRVALAAPTGKAAARLEEAVREQAGALGLPEMSATTLHRLLGWRPDSSSRFRHDAGNRLPYDLVVLDESSMVPLTMMARLLEALRPDTRLLLVGDPDQLTSVDAGAVLADVVARPPAQAGPTPALEALVGPDLAAASDADDAALSPAERVRLAAGVVRLSRGRRFGGAIAELAVAVRSGDADRALELLHSGDPQLSIGDVDDDSAVRDDLVRTSAAVTAAAQAGDVRGALAHLGEHRLLCAHREGPVGVREWDRRAREWTGAPFDQWYAGQPLLVTANDHEARVYNGDTGVVVDVDGELRAAFARGGEPVLHAPDLLFSVETVHAMTIHRSQGSQYATVSVVLPPVTSSLLTRELLYTAVTRATQHVRVLGSDDALRAGVERRVLRASGLQRQVRQVSGR
jgi:exodeoxyribonuclease V alpha subunit